MKLQRCKQIRKRKLKLRTATLGSNLTVAGFVLNLIVISTMVAYFLNN